MSVSNGSLIKQQSRPEIYSTKEQIVPRISSRRAAAAALLAGGALAMAITPTASAATIYWTSYTYYSDASMTQVVGRYRYGCTGTSHVGHTSPYYVEVDGSCGRS